VVDFIPDVRADCNGEKLLKLVNRSQRDHRNKSGLILIGSQGTLYICTAGFGLRSFGSSGPMVFGSSGLE